MIDATEHIGNWNPDIPDWFSWEKGLFYSHHFGTDGVDKKEVEEGSINLPTHFRFINLCLVAYQMTKEEKYIDLSIRFAERWADAILDNCTLLPAALEGRSISYSRKEHQNYFSYVKENPEVGLADNVDRAEDFLASDVPASFLKLWQITGNHKFRISAEIIIDIVATQIEDHDAGCGIDMIRMFRSMTGNYKYDDLILNTIAELEPYSFEEVSFKPFIERKNAGSKISGHTFGIGKRKDKPFWYEEGQNARHNPILLSLAAEIKNDEQLALRALDIGRTYFELGRETFDHGHQHGCGSKTVSAIARGNGRENNSGVVTAVLEPLLDNFEFQPPLTAIP